MAIYNTTVQSNNVTYNVTITTRIRKDEDQKRKEPITFDTRLVKIYRFRELASDSKFLFCLGYILLSQRAKYAKINKVIPADGDDTEIYNADEQAQMVNDWMIASSPNQKKHANFQANDMVIVRIYEAEAKQRNDFFDE